MNELKIKVELQITKLPAVKNVADRSAAYI